MPNFVAEKSQYRNCQWQEWVAFSADARAVGEAEISTLISRMSELARHRRTLFKMSRW
jgi:hypothetical protein